MIKITKLPEPAEWTKYRMTPGVDYQSIWLTIVNELKKRSQKGKPWSKKDLENLLKKYKEKFKYNDGTTVYYMYYPYCGIAIYNLQKKINSLR